MWVNIFLCLHYKVIKCKENVVTPTHRFSTGQDSNTTGHDIILCTPGTDVIVAGRNSTVASGPPVACLYSNTVQPSGTIIKPILTARVLL